MIFKILGVWLGNPLSGWLELIIYSFFIAVNVVWKGVEARTRRKNTKKGVTCEVVSYYKRQYGEGLGTRD